MLLIKLMSYNFKFDILQIGYVSHSMINKYELFNMKNTCVAESDQRHAQHPLKMLGIDFSCGSYQINSLYQTDMSIL